MTPIHQMKALQQHYSLFTSTLPPPPNKITATTSLKYTAFVCLFVLLLIFSFNKDHFSNDTLYNAVRSISKHVSKHKPRVGIVEVIEAKTDVSLYGHAIASVECYARIHNYDFRVINDSEYMDRCRHKDKFFRRHCVVAQYLRNTADVDYALFIDSDMGVVNPKRRIEEFIDPHADIVFYDRFFNWEVVAGSYLVKNTLWTQDFLNGYADFAYRLPNSFHGTDNGALHAYLAEKIFPHGHPHLNLCLQLWKKSKGYKDLYKYEACIRDLMGNSTNFGTMKIIQKGAAWCRDNWMTNSKWNPERDFMIHNWKRNQLRTYTVTPLPLSSNSQSSWFNPLAGPIVLAQCNRENTTWNYDRNLIATRQEIDNRLKSFAEDVEKSRKQISDQIRAMIRKLHNG